MGLLHCPRARAVASPSCHCLAVSCTCHGAAMGVREMRPVGLARPWERTIERVDGGQDPTRGEDVGSEPSWLPGQMASRQGQGRSKASHWHQSQGGGDRKGELGPNLGDPRPVPKRGLWPVSRGQLQPGRSVRCFPCYDARLIQRSISHRLNEY